MSPFIFNILKSYIFSEECKIRDFLLIAKASNFLQVLKKDIYDSIK